MAKSNGFVDFVKEQGVVGLAVGLAIGTASGAAVKALVDGLISPIVGFILGGTNLDSKVWTVVKPTATSTRSLSFAWGSIVSAVITMLATAFVIYYLVKAAKLDKLDKK
jgi:large conductance mechanosensitive channel protein